MQEELQKREPVSDTVLWRHLPRLAFTLHISVCGTLNRLYYTIRCVGRHKLKPIFRNPKFRNLDFGIGKREEKLLFFLNLNASKPAEHPQLGLKVSKRLVVM